GIEEEREGRSKVEGSRSEYSPVRLFAQTFGAFIESTSYTQRMLKESVPPIFQSTEAFQTTMVGSKRTRSKTAAMAQSVTAQSHSTHDPAIDMVAPPPLTTVPPTGPAAESSNLRGTAAELGGTSHQGEERRIDERTGGQLKGHQAGRAGVSRQGDAQPRDQLADMSRASASHTQSNVRERLDPQLDEGQPDDRRNEDREERRSAAYSQRNIHERLGPQGSQPGNPRNEDREERHSTARPRRTNSRRQAAENPSQTQSTNTPPRQRGREDRPSRTNEEVNQRRPNRKSRQRDRPAMCAEDVEKLVNDQLRDLKTGGNLEDALRKEMDQAISTPFTPEIEQAAPPKRFSTPSFIHFKGDSDPESHLKHFKSVMILHKADDALMCKAFAMTLRGAAQDWFHTLPSGSINSFKELAYVFTKEYTSYRTIKKNPDHLFNLCKKPDESIRDYIKRFKAEKANIVGCDDQIASSAFKKGLPAEHELYHELTITPSQTLAEVFATAERYALWDDDRIAAKKSTEQGDRPTKRAGQRSDGFSNKNKDKRRSHPQGDAKAGENYTKFTIPIHQILAQVKNKLG
ncbi:unnamed protein product, partial [Prunus brigantina]